METALAIIGWLGAGAVVPIGALWRANRAGIDIKVFDIVGGLAIAVGGPLSLVIGGAIFVIDAILDNPTIIKGRRK